MTTHELLLAAKAAAPALAWLGSEEKNAAILRMADAIVRETDVILAANEADVQAAKGTISDVMLDRLRLTQARIAAMADGMRQVSALPDPVGEVLAEVRRPNGLVIRKTAVPLGVVAIIYESRPNVTSDAAVLAMKSGNVCVLRGGKEAYRSAAAIVAAMHEGLREAGLPETFVNLVSDPTRRSAQELMTASGLVDLLIPRGGAGLIRACVESATVPCIETGTGICHVYVDQYADLGKAVRIIENAKTSRPSVCNAEEVCLVHRAVAAKFLPMLKKALVDDRAAQGLAPVELRLDAAAAQIIDGTPAGEQDFDTEYLDYILAVGVVDSLDAAIAHVLTHSTHHSDAIVTEDAASAERFINGTDSAQTFTASFDVQRSAPSFWNAETGTATPAAVYRQEGERTVVPVTLAPYADIFVLFSGKERLHIARCKSTSSDTAATDGGPACLNPSQPFRTAPDGKPEVEFFVPGSVEVQLSDASVRTACVTGIPAPIELTRPFTVEFDEQWGAPAEVRFDRFDSWTEHSDPGIRNYSGIAIYKIPIEIPGDRIAAGRRAYLQFTGLGEVGEITLNGHPAGTLWKPPYCIEITDQLRSGANELVISAANTWANRCLYDATLPETERLTWSNTMRFLYPEPGKEIHAHLVWRQGAIPSGVIGPVRIVWSQSAPLK